MRRTPLISLTIPALLAAAVLTGCASKPKPVPQSQVPSADMVQTLRETYKTAFPNAKVGVVSTVLPDADYAMVSDIDTTGLKEGNFISFIDADQSVIATGSIVKVNPNSAAVQFTPGARRVQVGDAAVKF